MSSAQIISRNQLYIDQFYDVAKHFKDILELVKKTELTGVLNANTRVYFDLVKEFYLNGEFKDGYIVTKVKGEAMTLGSVDFSADLGLPIIGLNWFGEVDTQKALGYMGYKKNKDLKGMKKKEFPKSFEFLADIVEKCILCKDSAFDSMSELQLQVCLQLLWK